MDKAMLLTLCRMPFTCKAPCGKASHVMCPVQAREGVLGYAPGTQPTCAIAAPPGGFHCCSGALLLMTYTLCDSP